MKWKTVKEFLKPNKRKIQHFLIVYLLFIFSIPQISHSIIGVRYFPDANLLIQLAVWAYLSNCAGFYLIEHRVEIEKSEKSTAGAVLLSIGLPAFLLSALYYGTARAFDLLFFTSFTVGVAFSLSGGLLTIIWVYNKLKPRKK